MNVRPKHWYNDDLIVIYGDALMIECEVYSPKSSKGRTVYVLLADGDVEKMLKECKDEAIRRRSKAMT